MIEQNVSHLAPLQGCLYCHSEGTTSLTASKAWGINRGFPVLKCSHCDSVAWLDYDPAKPEGWRIRYRRVNHAPRYFYVDLYLGQAGWLSAQRALGISTEGYVQRTRVAQARNGDLDWLQPAPADLPLSTSNAEECVYLTLKGVTLQAVPSFGPLNWGAKRKVIDSGKLYVTERFLHLAGQRRNWSHSHENIWKVDYDQHGWTIFLAGEDHPEQYWGVTSTDQWDPQLVCAVVESLWLGPENIRNA